MSILDKLPFATRKPQTEYFFALNLTSNFVSVAVWGIEAKKLIIIGSSQGSYSQDNLATVANLMLDEALGDFPADPTKVLFGVPDSWLENDNLKEDNVKTLKELVKELDISPLAYVSTSFAIAHLYQKQNGVPLTAILVNIDSPITVAVIKVGKILGFKSIEHSGKLAEDIEKALLGLADIEVLPTKIQIYSANLSESALTDSRDELQKFPWTANLPFLHLPKIEILPQSVELEAVCLAGASELEPDIIFYHQILTPAHQNPLSHLPIRELVKEDSSKEEPNINDNLKEVGFVSGDISTKEPSALPEDTDIYEDEFETLPLRLPIKQTTPTFLKAVSSLPSTFLEKGTKGFSKIFSGNSRGLKGVALNKFVLILAVIAVSVIAAYVILPKAKVTVFIDPKVLEKEAQVVADPSVNTLDEANKKIPGKIIEIDVNGSDKGVASGKKQIGDPAKGKVLLVNQTTSPKTFPKGTVLIGPNNFTYLTDVSATATSSAVIEFVGTKFGTVQVAVTAIGIGPEGNLSAGKQLTLKGESSSSFTAKVDDDIAGGTSKDVTVVTSDDQKKLLANVSNQLKEKARGELQGKLSGDFKVLREGLAETVIKSSFSKAVNDSASDFTLDLSAHYKGTAYSEGDLKLIVSKLVETNVPEGFEFNLSEMETQSDVLKLEKDNRLIFQAKFRAKLFPIIDTDKLKQELTGKSFSQVGEIVKKHETVIGSQINTSFLLPAPLQRMPFLSKNISVVITPK